MDDRFAEVLKREREMEEVLLSSRDPIAKVKGIMALGVEEDEATELVDKYQIGQMAPIYYERLEFDEDDEQ